MGYILLVNRIMEILQIMDKMDHNFYFVIGAQKLLHFAVLFVQKPQKNLNKKLTKSRKIVYKKKALFAIKPPNEVTEKSRQPARCVTLCERDIISLFVHS